MNHTIIIGGGITGLAAAYRLQSIAPDVAITLIEREGRLGGKLLTEHVDGFVIEGAPDSVLSRKPRGIGLFEELGLQDQVQGRDPRHEKTFVFCEGALHRLPTGLTGMIPTNLDALAASTLISPAGQTRIAEEATIPPAPATQGDESVAAFVTRRLGAEVYQKLVEPLMSGIYAGDGDQLSLAATFPQLRQLELKHGSLLQGLLATQPPAKPGDTPKPKIENQKPAYPPFVSLRNGMGELVTQLVARLDRTQILTDAPVELLERPLNQRGYQVLLADGRTLTADALILCTPAFATARLLAEIDPCLAQSHAAIPHVSAVIVTLAYPIANLTGSLDGYGYLIPEIADSDILACTWTSSKWVGRAPEGYALVRVYMGRYGRRDMTELPDDELYALADAEVRRTLALTAEPCLRRIHRWPQGMPQYVLGHPERLINIENRLTHHPGLYLAGAAYRGVGIPDCIAAGEAAAQQAADYLARST